MSFDFTQNDSYAPTPKRYRQPTHSIGIASMVLGAVSMLTMCIPFVGFVAIMLGVLGLLMSIVAFFQSLSRGGAGIGFPIAGFAMNLLGAIVAGVITAGLVGLPAAINKVQKAAEKASQEIDRKEAEKNKAPIAPKESQE